MTIIEAKQLCLTKIGKPLTANEAGVWANTYLTLIQAEAIEKETKFLTCDENDSYNYNGSVH